MCRGDIIGPQTTKNTHLSGSELPVSGHAVGRVHENLRNTVAFLDGLQLKAQQVALNAVSFKGLSRRKTQKPEWTSVEHSRKGGVGPWFT